MFSVWISFPWGKTILTFGFNPKWYGPFSASKCSTYLYLPVIFWTLPLFKLCGTPLRGRKVVERQVLFFYCVTNFVFIYIFYQCLRTFHCIKSVRIWSHSGPHFPAFGFSPYSVQMQEKADQNNSEYEHFLCSIHSFNFFRYIRQVLSRQNKHRFVWGNACKKKVHSGIF